MTFSPVDPWSGRKLFDLCSADACHLCESLTIQGKEEGVTAATESVLSGLKNSATLKVLVLPLYTEVHHSVHHVLKLVASGSLTRLTDLTDDHCIAVVLLAVISNHTQGSF